MADEIYGYGAGFHTTSLAKALANSKSGGNDATANRASTSPTASTSKGRNRSGSDEAAKLPPGITEADVATAQDAAANGDQASIDWLKALGIAGGVAGVGAAGLVAKSLMNRKKPPIDKIAAARNSASTTSQKALPAPDKLPYGTTRVQDEAVISGYLPPPQDKSTIYQGGPIHPVNAAQRPDVMYQAPDPRAAPHQGLIPDMNAAGRAKAGKVDPSLMRDLLSKNFKVIKRVVR